MAKGMTSPIRLAQVVYALSIGGSEVLAWRIARALNQSGRYLCSVSAVDHGGPLAEMLAADSIPARAFSRAGRIDLRLLMRMTRHFRANRIQLVHTHHVPQLLYGGIAGRLAGARIVHTEHDFHSLGELRSRLVLRALSGIADVVTTVAEPVTSYLKNTVGIRSEKLKTIPNGVDIVRVRSAVPVARSKFGWQNEDLVIGCIARLEPEKGHAILLEAFRRVRAAESRARLLLIGEGSEREQLEIVGQKLGLNGSVQFLGVRADVPDLLMSCDVLTLPSIREGLPIAILEAMAAGKPVVATEVGSVPEVVQHESTGLLVPPRDSEALAKALQMLLADPTKRRRLGAMGRKLVEERYSLHRTLEQYESVYASVLSSSSGG
jgi:glycosyltransferase involved in cell wall biosynthesis